MFPGRNWHKAGPAPRYSHEAELYCRNWLPSERRPTLPAQYDSTASPRPCRKPSLAAPRLCRHRCRSRKCGVGSSNRRRIFLTYNDAGKGAGLPETVFCKAAEKLSNRIVLGASGAALTEANFYNKVRPHVSIEAPVPLYANYDPETYAYFIMLEDLGGKVLFCDDRTEIDWERAI